jgi:hypothetical protein
MRGKSLRWNATRVERGHYLSLLRDKNRDFGGSTRQKWVFGL